MGIRIKFAGYDMVIFEGIADAPCYVVIEDDKVEFFDASDLWGMGSHDAEAVLAGKIRYGLQHNVHRTCRRKAQQHGVHKFRLLQARPDEAASVCSNGLQEDEGHTHQGNEGP